MPKKLYSMTSINHLGVSTCYSHEIDRFEAEMLLGLIYSHLPVDAIIKIVIYQHYHKCCFCGWSLPTGEKNNEIR